MATQYITVDELIERYTSELLVTLVTDISRNESPTIEAQIADSSARIDSYLTARYELPLESTPPILKAVCAEIVLFKLYRTEAEEAVTEAYREAMRWLNHVSTGRVTLGVILATDGTTTEASGDDLIYSDVRPALKDTTWGNFG